MTKNNKSEIDILDGKEAKFWKILDAAIDLDIQKGHLGWTVSQLAKKARTSRQSVYYYFGKNKEDILKEAINFFNRFVLGLTPKQMQEWEQGNITPSILLARDIINKVPSIIPFYYLNRSRSNAVGAELQTQSVVYAKKLKRFFPFLQPEEREAIQAIVLGLVFSHELSNDTIDIVCNQIHRMIKERKTK